MPTIHINQLAALSSGASAWSTEACPALNLPSITMNDGPHGVRKTVDAANLEYSIPATAFPTTACIANAWDRDLMFRVGAAVARECRELGVQVLLGPGLNIKRSPLGGRNFEYYSEDPVVAGELAAAFVQGVQSEGVAATVKHLTANNAEFNRMTIDARVSERALREIYLAGFERVIKKGRPWALMTAYNKLNGTYCAQHRELLTDILREEWRYDGLVMSDWTAVDDRPAALAAGLDLEMPGPSPHHDQDLAAIIAASVDVEDGERVNSDDPGLAATGIPRSIAALARLASRVKPILPDSDAAESIHSQTAEAHHQLALEAAASGIVLLKNNHNLLPFLPSSTKSVTVIGGFAEKPRFQGGGSSQINPTRLETILASAQAEYDTVQYHRGYDSEGAASSADIIAAAEAAEQSQAALLIVGLPDSYESEGFDRTTLSLPAGQAELIQAVCAVQPQTAVVIIAGSAVDVSWRESVPALLYAGLGGQAAGKALVEVISGNRDPRGKLTESFPERIEDTPCFLSFPGTGTVARYSEDIFVGYRFYETVGTPTAFPFGFGLTYTTFHWSEYSITTTAAANARDTRYTTGVRIRNTGSRAGVEVVQVYVSAPVSKNVRRPRRELRGFETVYLQPGESQQVVLELSAQDLTYWDADAQDFVVDAGPYQIELATDAHNVVKSIPIEVLDRIGPQRRLNEWDSLNDWLRTDEGDQAMQEHLPAAFYSKMKNGRLPTDEMLRNIPLKKFAQFFPERLSPQDMVRLARKLQPVPVERPQHGNT